MFENFAELPADPILGLITAFTADPNPHKIDLGAGVYKDEHGLTPVPAAVRAAETRLLETQTTKAYIAPPGDPAFLSLLQAEVFGADAAVLREGRVGSVQAPGGCGALRLGAELLQRARPGATLWVSAPTWANHVPLLGEAGLNIREYPYYDRAAHAVDFDAMAAALAAADAGDVVLLHGCCHNPCGADLDIGQWQVVADLANARGFLPFVDIAYHGLGDGLAADAAGLRLLAAAVPEMLLAYSCSKNFGLYRDRAGMISVLARDARQAGIAVSQMNAIARGIWSMPPAHGAAVVATILAIESLRRDWVDEVDAMRGRLNAMRELLAARLHAAAPGHDFGFIARERGMFSFLGVSPEQVRRLRDEHSVYLVDSSRIAVTGVTPANVDRLAAAVAAVLD